MWLVCVVNGSCLCCVRARVHAPCVSVVTCFISERVFVCAHYCFSVGVRCFLGETIEHYTKYSFSHSSSTTTASTNAQRRCKFARTPPWSASVALKITCILYTTRGLLGAGYYTSPGVVMLDLRVSHEPAFNLLTFHFPDAIISLIPACDGMGDSATNPTGTNRKR